MREPIRPRSSGGGRPPWSPKKKQRLRTIIADGRGGHKRVLRRNGARGRQACLVGAAVAGYDGTRVDAPARNVAEESAMPDSQAPRTASEELALKLDEEARANPDSPYAGKLVGIVHGKIVVVTDDRDELYRRLEEVEPDAEERYIVQPGEDFYLTHDIWTR